MFNFSIKNVRYFIHRGNWKKLKIYHFFIIITNQNIQNFFIKIHPEVLVLWAVSLLFFTYQQIILGFFFWQIICNCKNFEKFIELRKMSVPWTHSLHRYETNARIRNFTFSQSWRCMCDDVTESLKKSNSAKLTFF